MGILKEYIKNRLHYNEILASIRQLEEENRKLEEELFALKTGNQSFGENAACSDRRFRGLEMYANQLDQIGVQWMKQRLDCRLVRLEILMYYLKQERREQLDSEGLALLDYLDSEWDGRENGRYFAEDLAYASSRKGKFPTVGTEEYVLLNKLNVAWDSTPYKKGGGALPFPMGQKDGIWYADIDGKKLFLGENREGAEQYLCDTVRELEGPNPHRYLEPEKDGVDIPQGSVLCDIGAAEGFFGIRHIEKCKKVYFFECDDFWLQMLRKTCKPFGDKVEIIKGFVGDGKNDIHLDDFFRTREKPTVIKIDVEGAEGSVLRGMPGLLKARDPLTLLICTYHRQEDWDRYAKMLESNFDLFPSTGWRWFMVDPYPPYLRRGVMRAVKRECNKKE